MFLDFTAMEPRHAYQWMVAAIVPRPIAWVSTVSPDGRTNLAPFSFFQGVTCNPPTLLFVPGNTRDGRKKDTLLNIEANREFVVSLPSFAQAEQMNATAALLPYGESEFEAFGIAAAPSERVRPPRVAGAGVASSAPSCKSCRWAKARSRPTSSSAASSAPTFGRRSWAPMA